LNLRMVAEGWAAVYRQYCKDSDFTRREGEARAAGRGIWAAPGGSRRRGTIGTAVSKARVLTTLDQGCPGVAARSCGAERQRQPRRGTCRTLVIQSQCNVNSRARRQRAFVREGASLR